MAFGGSGGGGFSFGGNNNTTTTGFGGFGSTNNNTSGFGSSTTNATGFGSSTATANPFSGGTGAFGQNTGGGFVSNNTTNSTSLFGAKPNPFAASTTTATTGGLFGNSGSTTSGFGSTNTGFGTTNTPSTGFGASNNSGSGFSFGQNNKPAFGSGTTGGGLFGQSGQGTTGSFGAASSSPFGASGSGTALGNQPVGPSEGTAVAPFAPTVEKDSPSSTQSNAYQSISFMQPYQKYSFEELRLADYNAGRRYGNGTGQAGGFGSSTFGGGFGSTNTGGFGSNTGTTGGLFGGGQQSSSTGFGSNTTTTGFGGGGLFGNNNANKPGGLFGQQSSATASGGLFSTSNSTTGGFGNNNAPGSFGSTTNTGGLFGNNNNQAKPGGLFGSTNTTAPTGGFSFGNNSTTTPASTGASLFGNTNQQQASSTGFGGAGFGSNTQTQAKPSLFGNTGGAFGSTSTQGQTTSLFGTANNNSTGGGLFGQTNNASQSSGSLFGNTSNTGGGLFGQNNTNNDANKPAGGGLFGSSFGNTTNNSGGLFGNNNNQQQQSQGSSLFGNNNATTGGFSLGNTNNNQQQKPSLFGNTSTTQTGGGLFGQSSNNNSNGSMFGNSMNNAQQQQQQQQNTPRTASALDQSAYGQSSIWTGLPVATPQNSTPLVTPLRAAQNLKDSKARPPPTLKLNQSRYMTPPQKRVSYGFTYSTYGTPNSAASTPGTGGVFRGGFAGSLGRSSLGKSFSASNLRQQYAHDGDGILSPGAMTPKIANFSTGSMRRLKIDHTLRQDLFSPRLPALPPASGASSSTSAPAQTSSTPAPADNGDKQALDQPRQQPKKRVSFDRETTGGGMTGESGALVRTEEEETPTEEPQPRATRGRSNGKPTNSEMEQVRGNELAVVPEDRVSDNETSMRLPTDVSPQPDPEPGNYWMKPTRSELHKMPRDKLKSFTGLQVGRRGCGYVTFNGAVDLTSINLDEIFDKIVEIRVRSITVYPESSSKPPTGKGLNVPSTLYIENSWPRARNKPSAATSGPVFDKHIQRLRRMAGTEFLNYDVKTGVWTFKVPHYTRYGLDYDEDGGLGDSVASLPSREDSPGEMDVETQDDSDPDDTFMGKQKTVPGGYGHSSVIQYDDEMEEEDQESDHSVPLSDYEDSDNDVDMAGSFPAPAKDATPEAATPVPILKASVRPWGTPGRPLLDLDGDWAEQLQRTISPRKQNRDALREVQSKVLLDRVYEPIQPRRAADEKQVFRTSIDVMNSLFGKHQQRVKEATSGRKSKQEQDADFEFPYAKRAKTFNPESSEITPADAAWHDSFKPNWTGTGGLVVAQDHNQGRGVAIVKVANGKLLSDDEFTSTMSNITVKLDHDVPLIIHTAVPFCDINVADASIPSDNARHIQDIMARKLAHLLFDDYVDKYCYGLSGVQCKQFNNRIRRDRLTDFLSSYIAHDDSSHDVVTNDTADQSEHLAVLDLCQHDVDRAVDRLQEHKDFNLALMVSQLNQGDDTFQEDISTQINDWTEQNIISEISEPIRALYSILGGNTSVIHGKATGPVEDRASTFAISEYFQLNWQQAFGLTLWYGKTKNASIEESIIEFEAKLASGEETITPLGENGKEDILWVLLKLYASRKGQMNRPLLPQAIVESSLLETPLNSYHGFILYQKLVAKLGKTGEVAVDVDAADKLAADLAFELSSTIEEGREKHAIVGALFALLHIQDAGMREASVKELLNRFAFFLPGDTAAFEKQLKLPASWIWEAKALYARSAHDADSELNFLVKARLYEEAHECFRQRVAPILVIDEDWTGLEQALSLFPKRAATKDWQSGGAVYAFFVQAIKNPQKANLDALQSALVEMGRKSKSKNQVKSGQKQGIEELREHVAVKEMSRAVASMIEEANAATILSLPITSDARLSETKALAVEYYRGIMAR